LKAWGGPRGRLLPLGPAAQQTCGKKTLEVNSHEKPETAVSMGRFCNNIRIEGKRIKHSMGPSRSSYDKFGRILRIETTVNDVSFFKHTVR
jgi:hypothetical protein